MIEVPIRTLALEQRFTLHLDTTGRDIHGKLIRLNSCSATVKLDVGGGTRTFTRLNKKTGEMETVSLPAPATLEHWSTETLVIAGSLANQQSDSQGRDDSESEHPSLFSGIHGEGDDAAQTPAE